MPARPKQFGEMKQVSFRIPAELDKRLEAAQWALKMRKADVVRTALEELFDKHGVQVEESNPEG